MARRTKSTDNFIKSLDEYTASHSLGYTVRRGVRIFDDELYIFCESSGGRLRRTADDYLIISGRSNRKKKLSLRLLADALELTAREKKRLCACLDSGKKFAVMSAGDRVAIIYCGLLGSCGLGIACLANYPPTLIKAVSDEKYSYLFKSTHFLSEREGDEPWGDLEGFVNKLRSFQSEALGACGSFDRDSEICDMISAAAGLVGCGLYLGDTVRMKPDDIHRDTLAAILLCLFSAIRTVSSDGNATLRFGSVDGDAVITVKFNTTAALMKGNTFFIDFCRSFTEHYSIPFAYEFNDSEGWVSFIPSRIDPSVGGFKASVCFSMGEGEFTVKRYFDDDR